ncbi:hypothetical protein SLEP1_g47867 [Rubroshorea leprosula]|uniref:Uncharacterized protein n=1 Tax=Rubroshorea leprosula TaxID=152421 RepID=A0AAV5LSR1_9ROSI|nr:hypothetical protein SLEP1_g47867 [Rubroshorea leprosula]
MDSGYPSVYKFLAWWGKNMAREVDEGAPPKRSVLGKRKSVAYSPKSRAQRTSILPANKKSKTKAPTPSKVRITKEKETSNVSDSDESSWGDLDLKVIERIKKLRPICGGKHLGKMYYDLSTSFQLVASNKGLGPIPIPSDGKVLSKSEEAKRVEALAVNMEEALVNPQVRRRILTNKISVIWHPKHGEEARNSKDSSTSNDIVEGQGCRFPSNIDINKVAPKEFESDKVASPSKAEHDDQPSSALAKSSEANDFAVRLFETLERMNTIEMSHLSNLAKAYFGKAEFGITEGDKARSLDEWIKEQAKNIEEMEKSLTQMKELALTLQDVLVSAKAYLGSLN